MIEENTVEDSTAARLIGIRPTRPPLLDEVFILREAAVWLAFGRIAEPPDYNFAYVSQLEALLKYCREGKSEDGSPKNGGKSPTSPASPSSNRSLIVKSKKEPP